MEPWYEQQDKDQEWVDYWENEMCLNCTMSKETLVMKTKELNTILDNHGKWLRGEDGGIRADLEGADLEGADLRYTDLRYADLRGANLQDANLLGAKLQDATLRGADLRYTNLQDANLRGATLRGADLRYTNLQDANLRGANLLGANLRYVTGNGKEIVTTQTNLWTIVRTSDTMAIGCQQHSIDDWMAFHDDEISQMDRDALEWWKTWKPIIQAMIDADKRA